MLIAYMIIGIIVGASAAILALVAGAGIWIALAFYVLGGLVAVIGVVIWTLLTPRSAMTKQSPVADQN